MHATVSLPIMYLRMTPLHLHAIAALILALFWINSCHLTAATAAATKQSKSFSNLTDMQALISFKTLLHNSSLLALSSWNTTGDSSFFHNHYCQWLGVTCGHRHLRVIGLDLGSLNLTGPLSPFIANLTFLRRLHLADNQFLGYIPPELSQLRRLTYLNLSFNSLEGQIPTTLTHCSLLETIDLSGNNLQGEIPSNLSHCPELRHLSLSANNLSGKLPSLLGISPSLIYVMLWNNLFSGPVPSSLANSSTLQVLVLSSNYLTGNIPLSLSNCSSLTILELSFNALTGGVPAFRQGSAPRFRQLGLTQNNLTGSIPPSLGNLSSLAYLYLAENKLQGNIPIEFGNLLSLKELDLTRTCLEGDVPISIYNITSLISLNMGGNNLSGTLPAYMGDTLPHLRSLILQDNSMEGTVPASLSNASELRYIDLAHNSFSGTVPVDFGSLGSLLELNVGWNQLQSQDVNFITPLNNCTFLKRLFLNDNGFSGPLPRSLGNLSLEKLVIGNNQMYGPIPDEIGNLANLTVLIMEQNLFTGFIPATTGKLHKLAVLYLNHNNFSGPIPTTLGSLSQLNYLDLSKNQLTEKIPASLGGCRSLEELNLSFNALDGNIPKEVVSLSSLTLLLDLSHNLLSGTIPLEIERLINIETLDISHNQLLGEIPSGLGVCQHLEYLFLQDNSFRGRIPDSLRSLRGIVQLDLSVNNFSGEIPDFFQTFGSIKYLNLSFNNLEGQIPKFFTTSNVSEIYVYGNPKLCGDSEKLKLLPCSVIRSKKRRMSTSTLLKIILIPAAAIVSVILLVLLSYKLYLMKMARQKPASATNSSDDKFRKVSYTELSKATDCFSSENLIGAGSFGSVYKGRMDGEEGLVAVKVLNLNQKGALRSFTAECEALRNIRHRNLVRIITSCSSLDSKGNVFKALVYEFMPNGTLDEWVHQQHTSKLNIIQRLDIAINVASALDYLHNQCKSPVIHRDLKPSNVLLDCHMIAHVSDFGLARLTCMESNSMTSTDSSSLMGMKGSIGYVAPEYGMGSQVSTQGDVYSFGILLLEMLTGRRPTDEMFGAELNIHKYAAEKAFSENVMELIDPLMLTGQEDEDISMISRCAASLIEIGVSCSRELPNERMEIRNAVIELQMIKSLFQ